MVKVLKNKRFWGTIIAVALLAYCVKDIRLVDLESLGQRIDMRYLIPAFICTFLFVITKALRWRLLVSQHKSIGRVRAVTLYSAGQILNIVMPALTGQVGRMFLFARREGMRKTFVFSTIVLEIMFDAMSLVGFLLLTSVAFVFPEKYRYLSIVLAVVTTSGMILLYLILRYQAQLEEHGRRRLRHRWPGFYIGIKKFIRSFTKGMEALRSSQQFFGSLLYSMVSWLAHMLVVWFLLKSFGYNLPLAAAASVMIINTLALMIPITPGNAGTFEVAVSTSLAAFSVGRTDAVLFAVALHLIDLLPILVMGAAFLQAEKVTLKELKSGHEETSILDEVSEEGVLVQED